jgi:hypothetical protein
LFFALYSVSWSLTLRSVIGASSWRQRATWQQEET